MKDRCGTQVADLCLIDQPKKLEEKGGGGAQPKVFCAADRLQPCVLFMSCQAIPLFDAISPITGFFLIYKHQLFPAGSSWFFLLHSANLIMVSQPKTPPPFGDKNASAGLLATTILVTVLSIILVTLRFVTRIWIVKRVGWDDWCILFACVRMFCFSPESKVLNNLSLDIQLGQHWSSFSSRMALADRRTT